jgi:hypothetical protein
MSRDTTSILDLPTDPTGGGTIGGNVSFSINEIIPDGNNQGNPTQSPPGVSLDQNTITQLDILQLNTLKQFSLEIYTHAFSWGMVGIGVFALIALVFTFLFIPKNSLN